MEKVEQNRRRLALLCAALVAVVTLGSAAWPNPSASDADLHDLLVAIAEVTAHGPDDNGTPWERLGDVDAPVLTCSYVSRWGVHEVRKVGGEARHVAVLTLDEWNGSDDGHSMLEVRMGGRWVLYDLDRGAMFTDQAGRPLDLVGLVERIPTGDYRVRWIEDYPEQAEAPMREWFARVGQWPLVEGNGGVMLYPDDGSANADRVGSYADFYQPVQRADWMERIYAQTVTTRT